MHPTYFGEHIFGKNEIFENKRRETETEGRQKKVKEQNKERQNGGRETEIQRRRKRGKGAIERKNET